MEILVFDLMLVGEELLLRASDVLKSRQVEQIHVNGLGLFKDGTGRYFWDLWSH